MWSSQQWERRDNEIFVVLHEMDPGIHDEEKSKGCRPSGEGEGGVVVAKGSHLIWEVIG
jgi:hypothetical protein